MMGLIEQWKQAVGETVREQRASREQSRSRDENHKADDAKQLKVKLDQSKRKEVPGKVNQ